MIIFSSYDFGLRTAKHPAQKYIFHENGLKLELNSTFDGSSD